MSMGSGGVLNTLPWGEGEFTGGPPQPEGPHPVHSRPCRCCQQFMYEQTQVGRTSKSSLHLEFPYGADPDYEPSLAAHVNLNFSRCFLAAQAPFACRTCRRI
jgi:hypothetical protein